MLDCEIRELIQKQLPEQVGTVLRTRLDQAEKDAASVVRLTGSLAAESSALSAAQAALRRHEHIDNRLSEVEKREAAVLKREQAADLNEFKAKAAESAKQDIFKLAETVFKNPTFVRSESQRRSIVIPGNSYPQEVTETNFTTETIE